MDLLEGLNSAQKQAVVHEDGPLVVLAGPGTGKTRVITHRIARLILDSGAAPESIVALTFTVKAAEQMRARLRELLGAEHAAKAEMVTVSTFHGLGQRLVRRFGDILNVAPNAELMDSAQRKQVLRELIVAHGLYPEAAAAGVQAAVKQVSDLIDACGNQGVSAADAERHTGEWAKKLAKNAEGLDATALAGEKASCERFGRMARLYGMYAKVCRERGLIGFNDLIMLPVELLRTSKEAAAILRAEYRHAVVDEYQDVNAAQIEMLKGLFPGGGGGGAGPDLCVVGDDDQAIYGFRGADDRAFVKFSRAWPKHMVVQLTENYRSEQAVLDIANAVIARATERYAPDKVVERPAEMRDEAPKAGTVAQGVVLEDNAQDGEVIAAMLRGMRAKEPDLDWGKYAVLSRAHSDLERVAGALELEGIPFVRRAGSGAKTDEGVQDVLAFARMLLEPEVGGVAEVQRLLARPPHLVEGRELLEWQKQYLAALSHFENGNPDSPNPGTYLRWLVEHHGDVPAVMKVAAQEATLRPLVVSRGAGEVIYRIVTEIGAAHAELLSGRDHARRVVALAGLIRQARLAEARLEEPRGLAEFLAYYEDLSDKEQEGVDPREQVDGGSEGHQAGEGGAVQMLTAHSAKGLEFDTVFVIKAGPKGFGLTKAGGDSEMPEALVDRAGDTRDAKARAAAESRRLFYVAVTRAERRLVVMSTVTKKGSTGEHYFEELMRGAEPMLPAVEAADVLKDAARAPMEAVELEGRAYKALEARREVFERARREARRSASGALDSADRRGLAGAGPAEAERRLASAAIRLAVIAAEEAGEKAEWIAKDKAAAAYREELRAELGAAVSGTGASTSNGFIVPRAPLHLSYTYINDYLECPRCFYCKHVLRIPEPPSQEQSIGTVVHAVLSEFYGRWMKADAEGKRPPGLKELVELGEKRLYTMTAGQEIDAGLREQLKDQLRIAHEVLHNPEAQIIERPEWEFTVPLVLAGVRHDLKVQIDRIEQVEGGYRIVDYKTGQDWKKLTEPKADDLQMGVYALALDEKLGGGEPISGTAEYWLLASGQRGVLALDKLKREKVRGTIEKAVAGILAGEFGKGGKCRDRCEFLGP